MLPLGYTVTSNVSEAPFPLKPNNGIYLIDDFGRQIASPADARGSDASARRLHT